ncbi:unnamed protein product [Durusdinium trenchii]|uniref:BTB domain-containing protein n=1 Tax=Durusdinium trenchii TaxID=1381693 RepID=A0ABP0NW53_9DINO
MAMEQTALLWALLDTREFGEVKRLRPERIDLVALHPSLGVTMIVHSITQGLRKGDEEAIDTIQWLLSLGASFLQKCNNSRCRHSMWKADNKDATIVTVTYACHSAVSYVAAWKSLLSQRKEDWSRVQAYLTKVLRCFTAQSEALPQARISIRQGIVDLWERCLMDTSSQDLTFNTADGEVTAHSHVLAQASPVVAAMLSSPMKEGQKCLIEVKDASSNSVSLFLELLYTCSTKLDPDYQMVLQALDVAHRWQVEVVVTILADLLQGMITDESFVAIAEHSVLKGLENLKTAARRFGAESAAVQAAAWGTHFASGPGWGISLLQDTLPHDSLSSVEAQLREGRLTKTVLQLFPDAPSPEASMPVKRRRL